MKVSARVERWRIARPFTIARGVKTMAEVVVATIDDGDCRGVGECVPYRRYGESVPAVAAAIDAFQGPFDRQALLTAMPAGAARNAIDCALWDWESRRAERPVWQLAGVRRPVDVVTAYTLSLDSVSAMGRQAAAERRRPLLKLKLGSADVAADIERLHAVRENAPGARLIVDANEGWRLAALQRFMPAAVASNVELIEQPLPAHADAVLADLSPPLRIGADESIRDGANLATVAARYATVNIKLDKTGGLTQALALATAARAAGLHVMVGCMVATSLAMAPALLLAEGAQFVDLDGPLLLAQDRSPGLDYRDGHVSFTPGSWGFSFGGLPAE